MRSCPLRWLVALAALTGCGVTMVAPPPSTVRSVAVLPPANRTGGDLVVAGTSLLEVYAFGTDRTTVADVLAAELRAQLVRRGFTVVSPDVVATATEHRPVGSPEAAAEIARRGGLSDPVLFVAIDRFEVDAGTHPAFIIVAADAALVEPAKGVVLWESHRRAGPIATPGTATLGAAYEIAARKLAEELVASWTAPAPR